MGTELLISGLKITNAYISAIHATSVLLGQLRTIVRFCQKALKSAFTVTATAPRDLQMLSSEKIAVLQCWLMSC